MIMKIKIILLSVLKTTKIISVPVNSVLNKIDATERYRPQQK